MTAVPQVDETGPIRHGPVVGGVLTLELCRRSVRNALSNLMFWLLSARLREAERDDSVRVVVIQGHDGDFAAGSDIAELADHTSVSIQTDGREKIWQELADFSKPIIAAVAGYCLGGGCELAMLCDILIAGKSAKFAQPEINLGLMPGAGGTQRLPRAVGKSLAMYLALTGEPIDADRALAAGLVAEVVSDDMLLQRAQDIAKSIAGKPPIAARSIKRAIRSSFNGGLEEGLLLERRFFSALFATEDLREGISAYRERRQPHFQGK